MPPKPKLHKQTGKSLKSIPKVVSAPTAGSQLQQNSNTVEPSTSSGTTLNEQQFEGELCWCIQQLQNALKSQKLNSKQVQDHTKALNVLMSNTAPLIQKRQVMRLSFGDYRAKMQVEERKAAKRISMKVTPAKPSEKSMFLKKAFSSTSGNEFKFNFPTSATATDSNNLTENMNHLIIVNDSSTNKELSVNLVKENGVFKSSDNSFRFNFSDS